MIDDMFNDGMGCIPSELCAEEEKEIEAVSDIHSYLSAMFGNGNKNGTLRSVKQVFEDKVTLKQLIAAVEFQKQTGCMAYGEEVLEAYDVASKYVTDRMKVLRMRLNGENGQHFDYFVFDSGEVVDMDGLHSCLSSMKLNYGFHRMK